MSERRYPARRLGLFRRLLIVGRDATIFALHFYYRSVRGMDLSPSCRFSLQVKFDRTNPKGVHVGAETYIAFGVVILAHDMSREFHTDTYIGSRCFLGANAIIMPGVRIGDECIIGAGSVVTKDIPANSVVAGNPAKVIRFGIRTKSMGKLISENAQ